MGRRLGGDLEPDRPRDPRRLRADRDRGRRGRRHLRTRAPPSRRRARRRRPPAAPAAAAGCGRAATKSAPSASIGAARAPSAAAKSTRPGRPRELAQQPVLRRLARHERRLEPVRAQRLRGAGPDGRDRRQVAAAPRDLVGAVRARDDQPVVAGTVDRFVRRALDLDQRALHHLEPRALERLDERLRLRARSGDDRLHFASATSSCASATGSSPLRRSTHAPSSSAISACSVAPSWCAATGARQPAPIVATHSRSGSTLRARRRVIGVRDQLFFAGPDLQRERALRGLGKHHAPDRGARRSPTRARAGRARTRRGRSRRGRARAACAGACRRCRAAARSTASSSSASSCARLRADAVPIRMPGSIDAAPTSASRGSSRSR